MTDKANRETPQPEGDNDTSVSASEEDMLVTQERAKKVWPQLKSYLPLLWLIVMLPPEHRGTVLPIRPNVLFGRGGDVRWDDPLVSRQHSRFLLVDDPEDPQRKVYAVMPYHDRNGTYVNGLRIDSVTHLQENDQVGMGNTLFVVKVLE